MNKKLAEIRVNKSEDYFDKVVRTLENAGFVMVLDFETTSESHYIIAEPMKHKIKIEKEEKDE